MPDLEAIRCALAGHAPASLAGPGARRASLAVVLRAAGGTSEVLFIERARRAGDPWSGWTAVNQVVKPQGKALGDTDSSSVGQHQMANVWLVTYDTLNDRATTVTVFNAVQRITCTNPAGC